MQMEKFPAEEEGGRAVLGRDLPADRKAALLTERIKRYTQRVYKRVAAKPETAVKVAGVCQRENGFYVDTVLAFRDRRYEYKGLVKRWKKALAAADAKVRGLVRARAHACVEFWCGALDGCALPANALPADFSV